MSLQTLRLLQALLYERTISVGAPDEEIAVVLQAKAELAAAIEAEEARTP